jgi:hypothetical protein
MRPSCPPVPGSGGATRKVDGRSTWARICLSLGTIFDRDVERINQTPAFLSEQKHDLAGARWDSGPRVRRRGLGSVGESVLPCRAQLSAFFRLSAVALVVCVESC